MASWGKDRAPDYSSIWKRIGKTMPKFERNDMFDRVPGRTIRLVPDSTGVRLGNGGEWLSVKWKVARGFFKMHILVDLDTRRILAFSLTDVKGGDAAQLPDLLCRALGGYVGRGVSLPEPIAEMVPNVASAGKASSPKSGHVVRSAFHQQRHIRGQFSPNLGVVRRYGRRV